MARARAKVVLKAPVSSAEWEDARLIDAWRKAKVKEARENGRQEKVDPKEWEGPREKGQTLVTRGTLLGTIPIGTAKRVVLKWTRGLLLNLFLISAQSVCTQVARISLNRKAHREESKGFCSCEEILTTSSLVSVAFRSWINESQTDKRVRGQMSLFPGRSAGSLRFRGTRGYSGLCKTSLEES